jgi:hypothetical protein
MAFDLKQFIAKDTVEVQVVHPTEGPTDWYITLRGKASVEYMKQRAEIFEQSARAGRKALESTKHYEKVETRLLVASVLDWRGLVEDGIDVPFSREKAKELFETPGLFWLREFIDNQITDASRFF